ncbi:MAG: hypothetical protein ACFE0Q_18280, partial [Anaerolineae bacterium]
MTKLQHQHDISLPYMGDCTLLGIDQTTAHLYAEVFYEENYLAHYHLAPDGLLIESSDEAHGTQDFTPLRLPHTLMVSRYLPDHSLNYTGMRRKGMRDTDKVAEWVLPMPIPNKIPL